MRLKKVLALTLVAAMAVFFTACQSKETTQENGTEKNNSDFKVGVIHIGDPAEGAGYSYAHDLGIQQMQQELGLSDSQIIRKNNVSDSDAVATRTAIEECIEEGADIIFGTSFGYGDTMVELADEYPDIIFSHGTGNNNNGKNLNNYFGRIYQARYLTGIAAGLKTESNMIGYVAAMGNTSAEVTSGINAFALGVESVNPDAKIYVKVTNTWYDPTLEGQAAESLLDLGCDVIAQHQDTTAPQLAAQNRGVWGCGYNTDMTTEAPQAHLTAPIWNWGAYYTSAVKAVMDGTWECVDYFGGMADGMVDISPLSENCAEGTAEAVETAKKAILDDGFAVFVGPLYDNAGNLVCEEGQVVSDDEIKNTMSWYYKNVEVK